MPFGARVVDAGDRTERHAQAAVDALLEHDREAAEEVVLDPVDRIDLARAGVVAGAASDARLVDVEVAGCGGSRLAAKLSRTAPRR